MQGARSSIPCTDTISTKDYETELGRPWEKENRAVWDHVSMY